jgi:AcrR family transcriptional regulator
MSTSVKEKDLATPSGASPSAAGADAAATRARILKAAFAAFSAQGYAQTSMLEIATRAKVSKRELYALVGAKHDMLVACITERAGRMRPPPDLPEPRDRESLAAVLAIVGERILREVSAPPVLGVFRLAIAEAERAPEVAHALDSIGRGGARTTLRTLFEMAQARGLLSGDPVGMAERFLALLWGDLMIGLLLRVVDPPAPEQAEARAREAASAFLRLHAAEARPTT